MNSNIVITMAGRGSRFYDAGYKVPKYEIIAHDRSLFDWSMSSLANFINPNSRIIFVCLAENNSSAYVRQHSLKYGLKDVHIIELDEITDGQATSAYISRHLWDQDAPLLVYNIDTFVVPSVIKPEDIKQGSDGWVPCFKAPGEHWSFVKIGSDQWATEVAEKRRISENASIGLYWFSRARDYIHAYETFFSDPENMVKGERYIAPLYQQLIADGHKISIEDLPLDKVHVLGTPQELNDFLSKNIIL